MGMCAAVEADDRPVGAGTQLVRLASSRSTSDEVQPGESSLASYTHKATEDLDGFWCSDWCGFWGSVKGERESKEGLRHGLSEHKY